MFRGFRGSAPIFVLLLSEAVLLLLSYVLASFLALDADPSIWLLYDGGLMRILAPLAAVLFSLHFLDLYSTTNRISNTALVLETAQAVGFAFLVEALLSYISPQLILPHQEMMWGSGFALLSLSAFRVFENTVPLGGVAGQRTLFLGTNAVATEISEYLLRHPEAACVNLGCLDDAREPGTPWHGAKVLGHPRELQRIVTEMRPDRIVAGMAERRARMPMQELLEFRFSGLVVEDAGATYELLCSRIYARDLRPAQLIFSGKLDPRPGNLLLQSLYSPLIALAAGVVTLPLMLLAGIVIKLTSRGPVLSRHECAGLRGAPFTLYRFRCATPLGGILRWLRIDGLPQLWNVLHGEMGIVGPRPERVEFAGLLAERIPYYRQRQCVRPGITGWAQIQCPQGDAVAELEYDLFYIKHLSPSLDLYILLHSLHRTLENSRPRMNTGG